MIANKNGAPIFLKQVAEIEDSQAELETGAFLDGKAAVAVDILRSSDSNVIEVVDSTYKTLESLKSQLPQGTTLKVVVDSSKVSAAPLVMLRVPLLRVRFLRC